MNYSRGLDWTRSVPVCVPTQSMGTSRHSLSHQARPVSSGIACLIRHGLSSQVQPDICGVSGFSAPPSASLRNPTYLLRGDVRNPGQAHGPPCLINPPGACPARSGDALGGVPLCRGESVTARPTCYLADPADRHRARGDYSWRSDSTGLAWAALRD
jgi:hypothetical protein